MGKLLIKLFAACLLLCCGGSAANADIRSRLDSLSARPKTAVSFPVDYKILRPRLEMETWDQDYDAYKRYFTPAVIKTQLWLTATRDSIRTATCFNSAMAHAELDTATIIKDPAQLKGIWRAVSYRAVRYNDSASLVTRQYYRLPDSVLTAEMPDDAFCVFEAQTFSLYLKEHGKHRFHKKGQSRYSQEGQRYLLLYKWLKGGGAVVQAGIDERGYLILNFPSVVEHIHPYKYAAYYAVIQQYIFEKVAEQ
jgi:anthranilate/para-aminobenzoate synthase component I